MNLKSVVEITGLSVDELKGAFNGYFNKKSDYEKYLTGFIDDIMHSGFTLKGRSIYELDGNDVQTIIDCFNSPSKKLPNGVSIDDLDKKQGNGTIKPCFGINSNKYRYFISFLEKVNSFANSNEAIKFIDECISNSNKFNLNSNTSNKSSNVTSVTRKEHKNVLYYGVPGCGKSYEVNKTYNNGKGYEVTRTTFHPEYTYGDFVGQLLPKKDANGVTYEFVVGPFIKVLYDALTHPNKKYALIIEELNRGNAAAIFGDIFQLLDRTKGYSDYPINSDDICNYINKKIENYNSKASENEKLHLFNEYDNVNSYEKVIVGDTINKIFIPRNITLVATMNTTDQNLYPLDSAFLRRWKPIRVENSFDRKYFNRVTGEYESVTSSVDKLFVPGTITINNEKYAMKWKCFVDIINQKVIASTTKGRSNLSEDKQIGIHLCSADELVSDINDIDDIYLVDDFAEKVVKYIWDNFAKFNPKDWFVDKTPDGTTITIATIDDAIKAYKGLLNKKIQYLDIFKQSDKLEDKCLSKLTKISSEEENTSMEDNAQNPIEDSKVDE